MRYKIGLPSPNLNQCVSILRTVEKKKIYEAAISTFKILTGELGQTSFFTVDSDVYSWAGYEGFLLDYIKVLGENINREDHADLSIENLVCSASAPPWSRQSDFLRLHFIQFMQALDAEKFLERYKQVHRENNNYPNNMSSLYRDLMLEDNCIQMLWSFTPVNERSNITMGYNLGTFNTNAMRLVAAAFNIYSNLERFFRRNPYWDMFPTYRYQRVYDKHIKTMRTEQVDCLINYRCNRRLREFGQPVQRYYRVSIDRAIQALRNNGESLPQAIETVRSSGYFPMDEVSSYMGDNNESF